MKRFFISLFLFVSYQSYSQIEKIIDLKNDSLFTLDEFQLSKKELNFKIADSIKEAMMSDHWTTKTFDPFKKVIHKYPFKITFEDTVYASPIKRKKVITSRYGWRRGKPHRGIDIDLITGDKVMAMFDGKVRYVKYVLGHGQTVVIRHDNGLETIYSHLSKQLVKPNQIVKKGQVIGKGGRTGNARGSHLHLVARYRGVYINPEYLFQFNKENSVRGKEIWVTEKWTTPYLHSSKRKTKGEICTTYQEAKESEKIQNKIYVVKRGDTLSKISYKYNVSIASLCKTNSIRRNSVLRVGQKLILNQ
ncbi:M23 family metallopeptidase [Pseudotenacibaculum sp. MALMAid0570]|uniref:M23 family metallopeptidase n=1 Tax=Pseudotenacibaculum sp. MALMAid0570 TaxID=3143938 RepID=UPI0032DEC11C